MLKKNLTVSSFVLFGVLISCNSSNTNVREIAKDNSSRINSSSQLITDTLFFNNIEDDKLENLLGLNIHLNNITNFNHAPQADWCKNIIRLNNSKKRFMLTFFFEKNLLENGESIISIVDSNYGSCDLWHLIGNAYSSYGFTEISKLVIGLYESKSGSEVSLTIKALQKKIRSIQNGLSKARIDDFHKNKKLFLTGA